MTTKQREYRYETTVTLSCVAYTEDEAFNAFADAIESLETNPPSESSYFEVDFGSQLSVRMSEDQDFEYDERDA